MLENMKDSELILIGIGILILLTVLGFKTIVFLLLTIGFVIYLIYSMIASVQKQREFDQTYKEWREHETTNLPTNLKNK
jgi:hypothetical protein